MIKGTIYGDDKPVEGTVDIRLANDQPVATYTSNATTGKYLATLRPGNRYSITVSAPGFGTEKEELDLMDLDTYLEQNKDFYLYSQMFAGVQKKDNPLSNKTEPETEDEPLA